MTSSLHAACLRPEAARRLFLALLVCLSLLRAAFAFWLPFTSDEAYFSLWGLHPDWGFYDHPPMIGWWLAPLAALSLEPFVLRLPALLAPPLLAAIAVACMRRHDEARAWHAASLVLLVPLNAWNVAITTDIPLMLFSGLTVWALLRAQRSGRAIDYLFAGLMLAGALLSKYFAGLLAIAIFGWSVWRPDRHKLVGLAWVIAGALPAAVVQIAWNAQNCWPNLMFNLVNRHDGAGLAWHTPVLFVLSVVYVLTPIVAWRLFRARVDPDSPAGRVDARRRPTLEGRLRELALLRWLAIVPLLVFALLSPVKTIGLHWLASFMLPAVLVFVLVAGQRTLVRAMVFAGVIALAHWLLIGALAMLPTETFRHWKGYPGLVMTVHVDELADELAPWRGRYAIASSGYSPAVTLGHGLRDRVFVFGPGSSHARHDDILTDFRELAGRDILIVRKDDRFTAEDYDPYFDSVSYRQLELRGAVFHLIEGRGFRYQAYRDRVLDDVRRRWYAVPSWLPAGPCYFCDRYFPDRACHRNGS